MTWADLDSNLTATKSYGLSSNSTENGYWKFVEKGEETRRANRTFSNWNVHMFDEVQRNIYMMSRLPRGHTYFLDPGVASKAAEILAWLRDNTDANPPKIINEEGDTLIFTWENDDLKKYLCVDGEEIELEARRKRSRIFASEVVGTEAHVDVVRLIDALGLAIKSSTGR